MKRRAAASVHQVILQASVVLAALNMKRYIVYTYV